MIRLRIMKEWFDRVENGRSPIANEVAAAWFGQEAEVICGPASSNFVCRVQHQGSSYYLRLNHESERSRSDYESEMRFVRYLACCGMSVAEPVRSIAGSTVETVDTELGRFHAVMVEALRGDELEIDEIGPAMLERWGAAMARIHDAAAGYPARDRAHWRDHMKWAAEVIPAEETAVHMEIRDVMNALERLEQAGEASLLIHFDMELDNIRWLEGKPQVFDFDDCAVYPPVADLAFALRDLFHDQIERIDPADRTFASVLRGYRSVRALSESQVRLLPLLGRAHNLFWFGRIARAVEGSPVLGEADWMVRLREKLVRTMDGYRDGVERYPIVRLMG